MGPLFPLYKWERLKMKGPGGQSHCPGSTSLQDAPLVLPCPGRLGATHSKGEVVQRPAATAEWSPAPLSPYRRGAWLGPAGDGGQGLIAKAPCFRRDGAFCPAVKAGASGQGKCPLGRWRAGSMGRRQPPQAASLRWWGRWSSVWRFCVLN